MTLYLQSSRRKLWLRKIWYKFFCNEFGMKIILRFNKFTNKKCFVHIIQTAGIVFEHIDYYVNDKVFIRNVSLESNINTIKHELYVCIVQVGNII